MSEPKRIQDRKESMGPPEDIKRGMEFFEYSQREEALNRQAKPPSVVNIMDETELTDTVVVGTRAYTVPRDVAVYVKEKQRMEKHAMRMVGHGGGRAFADLPPAEALRHVLWLVHEQKLHTMKMLAAIEEFCADYDKEFGA